jgi:hypothetical protein
MILNRVQTLSYLFDNYTPICPHWISAAGQIPQLYWHRDTVLVVNVDIVKYVYNWAMEAGKIKMPYWTFSKALEMGSYHPTPLHKWVKMHFIPRQRVENFLGTPEKLDGDYVFHRIRTAEPLDLPEDVQEIANKFEAGGWQ